MTIFVSHYFSFFNDLKLGNTITMVPRMVSFDLVGYKLSEEVTFNKENKIFDFDEGFPVKNLITMNHLQILTMVSMSTKVFQEIYF